MTAACGLAVAGRVAAALALADMLTRIRNAGSAKHETVDVPASKMKKAIAEILLEEGYIKNFQLIDDGTQGIIRITLKYLPGKEKAIQGRLFLKQLSLLFRLEQWQKVVMFSF